MGKTSNKTNDMTDQRPWLKNYPKGVPANIDADAYPSIISIIEESFEKYSDLKAYACMGKTLTFKQIDQYSKQFGAYLHSRGLEPGDKIALMMPNLLQYPIALFGAFRAGLIVVNTNPLYTAREMKHQFVDAEVKAIVIAENFAANLAAIIKETNIKTVITTSIGELLGFPKKMVVNFVVKTIKGMVPKYDIPNTVSVTEALEQGKKFKLPEFEARPEDVVALQYTGGTTGVSKGAMLTNRNLVANMMQIRAWMMPYMKERVEIAICPLPLYHIFAFTVNCMALSSIGALNVLITNARDLKSVISSMKSYPFTLLTGVNTLFNALLNHKDFASIDFSHLKVTIGGAMAIQRPVAEKWKEITGCTLAEGYGMTEASPSVTTNPLDDSGRIGTIGVPIPSTIVRIWDEEKGLCDFGEIGELQIKGPQVMAAYFNSPDETANAIKDGWLCSGDLGTMDADGYIRIVDRKKDMILVSGFNVYPNEIEDVIAAHDKVLEVAAVGIPHEKSGEVVKVFVVKKDKSLSEKELIAYCRENLTGYKMPKEVAFMNELPKTNVGKILRRALRDS